MVIEFLLEVLLELLFTSISAVVEFIVYALNQWLSTAVRRRNPHKAAYAYSALAFMGAVLGLLSLLVFSERVSENDVVSTLGLVLSPAIAWVLVRLAHRADPNAEEDDPYAMTGPGAATFVFFFNLSRYVFLVLA